MVFFCYQIINKNTNISLRTVKNQLFLTFNFQSSINSCDQSLRRCFFIP